MSDTKIQNRRIMEMGETVVIVKLMLYRVLSFISPVQWEKPGLVQYFKLLLNIFDGIPDQGIMSGQV